MRNIDKAIEILQATCDGNSLAPHHLSLVEIAVNNQLNEKGEEAFQALYSSVLSGYKKPWFHGIENLTINHEGFVSWKGKNIEHFNLRQAYSDEAKTQALELQRRCQLLEAREKPISTNSVVWDWNETSDTR